MSNSINFIGRLGADAELKDINGHKMMEFRVANNVGFGKHESTNWFRCQDWSKGAENRVQYFTKGKQVFITGELSVREFTDSNGVKRSSVEVRTTSIDLIGPKAENGEYAKAAAPLATAGVTVGITTGTTAGANKSFSNNDTEDLPF